MSSGPIPLASSAPATIVATAATAAAAKRIVSRLGRARAGAPDSERSVSAHEPVGPGRPACATLTLSGATTTPAATGTEEPPGRTVLPGEAATRPGWRYGIVVVSGPASATGHDQQRAATAHIRRSSSAARQGSARATAIETSLANARADVVSPEPPTVTVNDSSAVTASVACTRAPAPAGPKANASRPPRPPYASIMTDVTPAGTVNVCAPPVKLKVCDCSDCACSAVGAMTEVTIGSMAAVKPSRVISARRDSMVCSDGSDSPGSISCFCSNSASASQTTSSACATSNSARSLPAISPALVRPSHICQTRAAIGFSAWTSLRVHS